MLVQQGFGVFNRGAFGHGDEFFALRHDVAHGHIQSRFEADVAPRDNAGHFAAVNDRKARNPQLVGQLLDLQHRSVGRDHDRIAQDAAFVALDLGDLHGLLLRREVFVNDADAAFLRHGDGQTRFGHGIHGGRYQRQIQGDIARQSGLQRCVFGQNLGVRRNEKNVIKRKCFTKQAHGRISKKRIVPLQGLPVSCHGPIANAPQKACRLSPDPPDIYPHGVTLSRIGLHQYAHGLPCPQTPCKPCAKRKESAQ